jgi:hypothetical protein
MNWKDLVKAVAPVLGTALGSPFGGMATKFLADKLLGDEDASEEQIEKAVLGANPDTLVKIRELDNDFKLELKRIGLAEKQLVVDDRQGARKLFSVDKRPQIILSGMFIGGYFTLVFALIIGAVKIDPHQEILITTVISVLTAGVANIMQFWFGSSSGSKDKTAQLGAQ